MSAASEEVLGTVGPDGTLALDAKLAVPPGRVRVRVEAVALASPAESMVEFVDRTRRELEAAGHKFRTKEETDAELKEMDDEWEERMVMLEQLGGRTCPPKA